MKPFGDSLVRGENVLSFGLENKGVLDPLALLTFGFISDCHAIWVGQSLAITTNWTAVVGTTLTVWTDVTGTIWGEC